MEYAEKYRLIFARLISVERSARAALDQMQCVGDSFDGVVRRLGHRAQEVHKDSAALVIMERASGTETGGPLIDASKKNKGSSRTVLRQTRK